MPSSPNDEAVRERTDGVMHCWGVVGELLWTRWKPIIAHYVTDPNANETHDGNGQPVYFLEAA